MHKQVDAIVLKKHHIGEYDCICSLYTRGYGKIRAAANNALRPRSRFMGLLEPFNVIDATLFSHQNRDLERLTEAKLMCRYPGLVESVEKVSAAFEVIEVLDRFTPDSEPDPILFQLAIDTLDNLSMDRAMDEFTLRLFECTYLIHNGFSIHVNSCIRCGRKRQRRPARFHSTEGGVICTECSMDQDTDIVSAVTLQTVQYLIDKKHIPPLERATQDTIQKELRTIIMQMFQYHLGDVPHTWQKSMIDGI